MMKVGVVLPTWSGWRAVRELSEFAEEVGVDSVWVPDRMTHGALEAWTGMSALAAQTERVQIGAHMLNASVREPALLAHMARALAEVSGDRLRILLGTGWNRGSYEALGRDFPSPSERVERTTDALRALKDTCAGGVDVAGVQQELIELAAAEADGWAVAASALDAFFERIGALREACSAQRRPLADLRVSCTIYCAIAEEEDAGSSRWAPHLGLVGSVEDAMGRARDLVEHGVEEFRVVLPEGPGGRRSLERLLHEVRPELHGSGPAVPSPSSGSLSPLRRGRASTRAANRRKGEDAMAERMIRVGDLELWTESFGDPEDPTILLVNGPGPGMLFPDELCRLLVDGGRRVIRYDHRDIGRSASVDYAESPYTISELAADAVGVLDAFGVAAGHLVGFSMGGMIAQTAALEHADRVASLTSWGSTPLGASYFGMGADGVLPAPDGKVVEAVALTFQAAANDHEFIERMLAVRHLFAGSLEPVDDEAERALIERVIALTRDRKAAVNLPLAGLASPDRTEALAALTVPTLVIHGTADPAVPLPHGEATAKAIPRAQLLTIEGLGHDFPRVVLPRIVAAVLEHTDRVPDTVQA